VKLLAERYDAGDCLAASSNSNRLCELAERCGKPAYIIDGAGEIQRAWLDGKRRVGITAGASALEVLVREVIAKLQH
jgi:4-hydroxy-3-methylbut-2-enyl diphosphate reductase